MIRIETDPFRVDWFAVLTDLKRCGLASLQAARQIEVPHSTVMGWKEGSEPKHADGERLIDLWIAVTGRNRHQLPRNCHRQADMQGAGRRLAGA